MIYDPDHRRWLTAKDCVWDSKIDFLPVFVISKHYSDCINLFHFCLGIENVTVDLVIDVLASLPDPTSTNVSLIRDLLIGLSQYITGPASFVDIKNKLDESGCAKKPLIPLKLFRKGSDRLEFLPIEEKKFYVFVDRVMYVDCFNGSGIWQADFSEREVTQLASLMHLMRSAYHARERRLSKIVTIRKNWGDIIEYDECSTRRLRGKISFIQRSVLLPWRDKTLL